MFINKNKLNNIQFHTNVMYMVYLKKKKSCMRIINIMIQKKMFYRTNNWH